MKKKLAFKTQELINKGKKTKEGMKIIDLKKNKSLFLEIEGSLWP